MDEAVSPLWSPETSRAAAIAQVGQVLGQTVADLITSQVRDTIETNALRDPRAKRFARVPRGKTCAFCTMLASRGWVYTSAKAAGEMHEYHSKCDCVIVPSFGKQDPVIKGYDPDAMYKDYEAARDLVVRAGKHPTDREIARAMRSLGGSKYTDGAGVRRDSTKPKRPKPSKRNASKDGSLQRAKTAEFHADAVASLAALTRRDPDRVYKVAPDRVVEVPPGWPDDLPPLRAKEWYHALYGDQRSGGHLHGYGWRHGRTEFPPDWGPQDIWQAAIDLLRQKGVETTSDGSVTGTINGVTMRVGYRNDSKARRIKTITPLDPNWVPSQYEDRRTDTPG